MASKKRDIGKLLRKYGYSIPKSSDEIEAFEDKFGKDFKSPKKWEDIKNIIKEKDSAKENVFIIKKENNKSASNLAMAARDGKKISKEVRDKMNKDKKDARKK